MWHGFTQMSTFAENDPIIVERSEGHELIDVDGHRYLDAISSLWVNTLGHCIPELDDAIRQQLELGAHSTMLGNGNRAVIELSEALARVVPVDDPHFLYASDGASAVEQALKIAFQHWVNLGAPRRTFLAFGGAYHGDTIGALSVGDDGFGADIFNPLRFPGAARARVRRSRVLRHRVRRSSREHATELAAVIVEPLVQGAAGMQLADRAGLARLGAACTEHDVLLICDEVATGFGRTGTLFASEQAGLRPDLLCLGKAMTAGYLADVGDGRERPRVPLVPRRRSRRAHAVPRPLLRRERARGRGRAAAPRAASKRGTCSPTCASAPTSCATCCTIASRRSRRCARCASKG